MMMMTLYDEEGDDDDTVKTLLIMTQKLPANPKCNSDKAIIYTARRWNKKGNDPNDYDIELC